MTRSEIKILILNPRHSELDSESPSIMFENKSGLSFSLIEKNNAVIYLN
jgi:hypothetical protein